MTMAFYPCAGIVDEEMITGTRNARRNVLMKSSNLPENEIVARKCAYEIWWIAACTLISCGDCGVPSHWCIPCSVLPDGAPRGPDDDLREARIACYQGTQRKILLRPCALQQFWPELLRENSFVGTVNGYQGAFVFVRFI